MARLSVFVACPYVLFPLPDYKKVFEAVARVFPVTFKFADEQITSQHILTKISNYIREHDISLFDITGWNPNVALELGIAVGMGKKYFILLNTHLDKNKEAPSDIRGIERIQYVSNQELEAKISILLKQELPDQQDRSESAFESIKGEITKALVDGKGIGLSGISELVGEDKAIVQSVLKAMVQSAELKTTGAKKGTKYYLETGSLRHRIPDRQERPEPSLEPIKDKIMKVLVKGDGLGLSRISELAGEDKAIVQSALKAMVQSAELKTTGAKKGTQYHLGTTDLRRVRRAR